jgi:hypothetical protein
MYFIGIPLFALKAPKRFILNNSLARPGIVDKAIIGTSQPNGLGRRMIAIGLRADRGRRWG